MGTADGSPYDGQVTNANFVLEGGGVKVLGLVGALTVLDEHGYQPQHVAGTSAGAMVATLLAAGYAIPDLSDIIMNMDFSVFRDPSWEYQVPVAGLPLTILRSKGLYKGDVLLNKMRELLAAKGVRTFRDLIHPDFADQPRFRYRARVVASDVTAHQILALPQDAAKLGIEPDDLEVALAVRMSTSIPIFFAPVEMESTVDSMEHLIVDGGILSNFPLWLFDDDEPTIPTIGLKLVAPNQQVIHASTRTRFGAVEELESVIDYLKCLAETTIEAHDRLYLESDIFARTITVSNLGIPATEFDLSPDLSKQLFEEGRAAAKSFLETWDFQQYQDSYGRDTAPSRRERIAREFQRTAQNRLQGHPLPPP